MSRQHLQAPSNIADSGGAPTAVEPGGARGVDLPRRNIPRVGLAKALTSAPNGFNRQQDGHPPPLLRSGGRDPLAGRRPGSAGLQAHPPSPPCRHFGHGSTVNESEAWSEGLRCCLFFSGDLTFPGSHG